MSRRDTYENPKESAREKDALNAESDAPNQNGAGTCVSDWHKIDTTETRFVPSEKENAATSAKVNGVTGDEETTKNLHSSSTPKHPDCSIAGNIPDEIKRLSRAIGYAAWLDTSDAWLSLRPILQARLDHHQLAALAFVALRSMGEADGYRTASAALFNTMDGEVLA
ncbi:hypothetical protein [Shimia gijangensis]|uniref:hypothetical protein n=1 Tax=Shimia gijangensis TaxID=1470563 RepID=UPI0009329587|nr:hypothetical protein [Shimia gijangensis]